MFIGISGKARVGKTTASELLKDEFGFIEMSFADELKFYAEKYGGFTTEELHTTKTRESRRFLQALGTVFREEVHPNYWVDKLRPRVVYAIRAKQDIVIPDVRMINEAEFIKEYGGFLIRIERESARIEYGNTHSSETDLDNYDGFTFVVDNTGSIEDLHGLIREIVYDMDFEEEIHE